MSDGQVAMHSGATSAGEFASGWRVVVASAVGVGLGLSALPFYTLGVFVVPLGETFGWSRAQVQGSLSFMTLGTLLSAWLVGWLADRYGVRRVALISQVGLACGLLSLALARGNLAMWYVTWLLMAMLGVGTTPIIWTRGIAGWFEKKRGLAFGIALTGTGATALLAPPLMTRIASTFGWRTAYATLAASVLLIALPVAWRLFHERTQMQRSQRAAVVPAASGMTLGEAARSYRFWLLIAGFATISFGVGGLIPNLVPLLTDRGLSRIDAAFYASVVGFNVICGRLIAGYLLDRLWAPGVALVFLSLPAVSCLLLAQDLLSPALIGPAAAFVGLAAGAEFDLIAYMCARYFGMRNYAQIYAWQWVAFMAAAGCAPPVFGRVHDVAGSYDPVLQAVAAAFVIGPLLLLGLGRYPSGTPHAASGGGASQRSTMPA